MPVNDAGFWSPDDTEVFAAPELGLHSWFKRAVDSVARPEGVITQPWRCHFKTTSQTVSTNTFTDVSTSGWTAGPGDPQNTASGITHSSDGYTVSQDGWYRVEFEFAADANSTGFREAQIRVNGNVEITRRVAAVSGSATIAMVYLERSLNAGDVVSFWVRQNSGGNLGMPTGSDAGRKFIRRVALL